MSERRYHLLLILFGLAVACTALSATQGKDWVLSWLVPCCMTISMYIKSGTDIWIGLFYQSLLLAVMFSGLYKLLIRLWKTHRFVFGLTVAHMSAPPSRLARLVEGLGLSSFVVVLSNEKPLAFCFGFLRPRICLSTGMADTLTDAQLKAVLSHEDYHRRHFDPLRTLFVEVLRSMLFFLPVVTEVSNLIQTSFELKADRYAAKVAGRASLAGALHQILSNPLNSHLPETVAIRSISATDARIAQLLGEAQPRFRLYARSLVVSSLVLFLVCILA